MSTQGYYYIALKYYLPWLSRSNLNFPGPTPNLSLNLQQTDRLF